MFVARWRSTALMLFAGPTVTCSLLVGCGSSGYQPPPPAVVTIGVLAATTGPESGMGRDAIRGAELAVDLVNQARDDVPLPLAPGVGLPRLAGAELRLQIGDTKGAADEAKTQTDILVTKYGVAAVVAAAGAEVVTAASAAAERSLVPFVDACTAADYLTELGQGWYFRTGPSERMLAQTAFDLLQRQQLARQGSNGIALLRGPANENADSIAVVIELAKAAGFGIVADINLASARGGVQQTAQTIAAGAPQAVVAVVASEEDARFVSELASRLESPLPVLGLGRGFARLSTGANGAAMLRTVPWSGEYAARNPQGKAVAAAYEKKFNAKMTESAAHGFTAVLTTAIAVDAGGTASPAGVRASLRQIWLPATQVIMPWDGLQFDLNGQNRLASGVVEQRAGTGFRIVFPREIAGAPLIWPTADGVGSGDPLLSNDSGAGGP